MQVFFNLDDFKKISQPTAVAIGNFDGIHLGHQKILEALAERAQKSRLISVCLTFEPHTANVIHPGRIRLLQTLTQKLNKISQFDIFIACTLLYSCPECPGSGIPEAINR